MRDAFISYSTLDSTEAYALRTYLQNNGCTCWMAPDDIAAGSDYAEAIPRAIADCRTFVLILSANAQDSIWVRKEVGKALDKGKTVIPFMIDNFNINDTFDFLLENAQWCHAYTDHDAAQKKLLAAVKGQKTAPTATTSDATPPKQTTYTAPKQTTYTTPKQTTYTAPKQTTYTAPKPAPTRSKRRRSTMSYSAAKAITKILYALTILGALLSVGLLLAGLSMFLESNTAMGSGAYAIMVIGMIVSIILLFIFHKKDLISDAIIAALEGNFIFKVLLWIILSVSIFCILGIIITLSFNGLQTPSVARIIAGAISGIISLFAIIVWKKEYAF